MEQTTTERRYGLDTLTGDARAKWEAIGFYESGELEQLRFLIQGHYVGWESLGVPPPPKPAPLFERSPDGPWGTVYDFINVCWNGEFKFSERVGNTAAKAATYQNHWAQRVMYDVCNRNANAEDPTLYNMLAGPTSCGKTGPMAIFNLVLLYVFRNSFAGKVCTTSIVAGESRIWGDVLRWHKRGWYGRNKLADGEFQKTRTRLLFVGKGDAPISQKNSSRGINNNADALKGIELVAVPQSADGRGAVMNFQGMKQLIKLCTVDESQDVDSSIFGEDFQSNWLQAGVLGQICYMTNPSWHARSLVANYKPLGGWSAPDYRPDSQGWRTENGGYVTNMDGFDTPNRHHRALRDASRPDREPPAPFPFLLTQSGINRELRRPGGEDSASFWSKIRGFLTEGNRADCILTPKMIDESGAEHAAVWRDIERIPLIGLDPAYTGDKYILVSGELGVAQCEFNGALGFRVCLQINGVEEVPKLRSASESTESLQAQWVVDRIHALGCDPRHVGSDATGSSGEAVGRIEEKLGKQIYRLVYSGSTSERPVSPSDPRPSNEAYNELRSELVFSLRTHLPFLRGFTNQEAHDQAGLRRWTVRSRNRVYVETKLEYRANPASNGKSPDELDAHCVILDLARTMGLGSEHVRGGNVKTRMGRRERRTLAMYGQSAPPTGDERPALASYGA